MTMRADLRARIENDAAVNAIVGGAVAWFERKRGDGFPCVILNTIDPGRDYDHEGPDALENPRVQIDSYGRTPAEADALCLAVRAVMEAAATEGETRFWGAFLEGENTFAEGEQDGGGRVYRVSQDYTFFFKPVS
jgi:Protein of unknown function (DUF3168)